MNGYLIDRWKNIRVQKLLDVHLKVEELSFMNV